MSTSPDHKQIEELRKQERKRLSTLPSFPADLPGDEKGVLLSDRIKHYCQHYHLIAPFDENLLRPAAYVLSVGRNYSIGGEHGALNDGMPLKIEPYQVAIIETYETINMPAYLIGRWNIQVKRAYQGLLWVGGAQVDPGFRGYLCCPIYNLSTEAVTLQFRDTLAVIDFVTTTPYAEGKCLKFDWAGRKKLVFPEYGPLQSGIEARVKDFETAIKDSQNATKEELSKAALKSEESFRGVQNRIDTFLTLVFTVVAVLFAGLGIVATKGSDEPSFVSSPVWIAAVALYFALRSYLRVRRDRGDFDEGGNNASRAEGRWWHALIHPILLELLVGAIIVFGSLGFHIWHAHVSAKDVQQAKDEASQATTALTEQKGAFDTQIRQLRQQSNDRIENLQQQIRLLQQSQSKKR